MPSASSIDSLLDNHRDNEDVVRVGKLAIADAIARAEAACILNNESIAGNPQYNVYFLNEILNLAVAGHTADTVEDSLSNLNFITFNYDRCIERYADVWLANRFAGRLTASQRKVNVVHVYGSIADYVTGTKFSPLENRGQSGVQWGNPAQDLWAAADRLKTFTETTGSSVTDEILTMCNLADAVFFTGFAFEAQNMKYFEKGQWGESGSVIHVYATTMGIHPTNVAALTTLLKSKFLVHFQTISTTDGKFSGLFAEHNFSIKKALLHKSDRIPSANPVC